MAQEETSAAGGEAGGAPRQPAGTPAPWDPEQWWSFGEAADRAGVTHRTLQGWAERGELMVRMAWREGTEFRLVRAGDVARLAPGALSPGDPSAPLEERALYTGPRRSALGAGAPVAPREPRGEAPDRYEDDRDAFRRAAEMEIERLRGELDLLRSRGVTPVTAASPAAMDLWSIEETRRPALLGAGRRWRLGGVAVFVCGLALGVLAGGLLKSSGGEPPGAEASVMQAPVGVGVTKESSEVASLGVLGGGMDRAPSFEGMAPEPATEDLGPGSGQPGARTASGPEEEGGPVAAPAGPVASARVPLGLAAIGGVPSKSLDGRSTCEYGNGELATPSARLSLGGCWGELAADGAAVLATDRVQGVSCCKHHAAVQRLKGVASSPRALAVAREEATQATHDGLVPPMLELRAERTAALLARALTEGWRASGFDGPIEGRAHRWSFGEGEDAPSDGVGARLELESWVERGEDGAYASYRMVLELGESAAGDRAIAFQWLE